MSAETDALAALEQAVAPRTIASVTRDDDEDQMLAYRMRLSCGHVFWLAVRPVEVPMPCMVCINIAEDAVEAARRPAGEPRS